MTETKKMELSGMTLKYERMINGVKIKPPVADARNNTGITALAFNDIFLEISYTPKKKQEIKPNATHINKYFI